MWAVISITTIIFFSVCSFRYLDASFALNVTDDGKYSLQINGVVWLNSAPTFFNENGTKYTTENKTLNITKHQTYNGTDNMGAFIGYDFQYTAALGQMGVTMKDYTPQPYIVFEQKYLNETNKTRNHACPTPAYPPVPNLGMCFNETISGFPSFLVQQPQNHSLGFLSLGGKMFGDFGKVLGSFNYTHIGNIADGMRSGPLALFDDNGYTLLISPLTKFMTSSLWYESTPSPRLSWGIMGGVDRVPENYGISTIIVIEKGINQAFQTYGGIMRKLYNTDVKRNIEISKDFTINYLGYWTDNGAYYYYNTEENKTYSDTLLDVKQYAFKQNIPFRYLQIDSWWYYKSYLKAVQEWTARPDIFPYGIKSNDTVYAKANGGKYNFLKEYILSLPNDQSFWNDLIFNATQWGLILYEQDWLNIQTLFTGALQTDLNLGETWLSQMGNAAKINGIALQYCMALPRHALQSLTIPSVTQVRVSEDYLLEMEQWRIGISSMFADALNVRPYKDTFWSSANESGNPMYGGKVEPAPALEAVVSTLSTGPVGPGDKINMVNKTLLMRCCNQNGLILKPSKPATAIDKQIIKAALPYTTGPQGEVWTTYSVVNGMNDMHFGIILAADVKGSYDLQLIDTGLKFQNARIVSYNSLQWSNFGWNNTLTLTGCTKADFCLYYLSPGIPLLSGQTVYILGERSKWVPVSPQRIIKSTIQNDTITLIIQGKPSEKVSMDVIVDKKLNQIVCTIATNGTAIIDVVKGTCSNNTKPNNSAVMLKNSLFNLILIYFIFTCF